MESSMEEFDVVQFIGHFGIYHGKLGIIIIIISLNNEGNPLS